MKFVSYKVFLLCIWLSSIGRGRGPEIGGTPQPRPRPSKEWLLVLAVDIMEFEGR
jgi:hypothetical protein